MKCCALVSIGDLRTPVSFKRLTTAATTGTGDEGGTSMLFAVLRATRAQVVAASGREVYAGDRVEARAMYRVTCRYFPGLLERDLVEISGVDYNIRRIVAMNDDKSLGTKWLVVDAERGVAK